MDEHQRKVMFSKGNDEWETPQHIFDSLNEIYNFTQDVCASPQGVICFEKDENGNKIEVEYFTPSKCSKYFTIEDNALEQDWSGEVNFMNKPYSQAKAFIEKAYEDSRKENTIVVSLCPVRTETKWFKIAWLYASNIFFYDKRIQFLKNGKTPGSAAFPSAVIEFDWRVNRCANGQFSYEYKVAYVFRMIDILD